MKRVSKQAKNPWIFKPESLGKSKFFYGRTREVETESVDDTREGEEKGALLASSCIKLSMVGEGN